MVSPKIFISYRRADSQDFTDRLFDYMAKHFGAENVFQDVGDSTKIPLGVDFVDFLADQVRACDVVLVVIGEQWTRILKERAKQENDFVRIEVESALVQGKLVIPVLKSATQMPTSDDLPESIKKLARLNASRVRPNPDFVRDCETLADGVKAAFGRQGHSTSAKPNSRSFLPAPFDWIEIPQKGYSIAKYPITNAQFAVFKDDGGYQNQEWWLQSGWNEKSERNWKPPRYWHDPKWNAAELPVVGVSWYEAWAFTRWLSHKIGEDIQLPTETQWHYAAQGEDNRPFPWGTSWNSDRCNCSTGTAISQGTTPVTKYENIGNSPFGVVDMIGNVWEWCLDWDQNKQPLRGGCWRSKSVSIEKRTERRPELSFNLWGFRMVKHHN